MDKGWKVADEDRYVEQISRIAAVETTVIDNTAEIAGLAAYVDEVRSTCVAEWDFHTLRDEVEEMRYVLYRLKNLLNEAEEGMFDTPQFLGNLRELLA